MIGTNPFGWSDAAFLGLYALLFVGALLLGGAIAAWLRPDGSALPVTDEDELAVIAGGRDRLAETVVARLLAGGQATIEKGRVTFLPGAMTGSPAERDLAALSSPAKWSTIRHHAGLAAGPIEDRLVARGVLIERGEARRLGLYAAIPLLLLLVFGLVRLELGAARDLPVGFLLAFLAVTAIAVLFRVFATGRRTRGAVSTLEDARERSLRLRLAPTREETGLAVALFGTAVLVGSPLADLHQVRREGDGGGGCSGGDGGSDGDGGGDGGSGCGGGGCGGCGG